MHDHVEQFMFLRKCPAKYWSNMRFVLSGHQLFQGALEYQKDFFARCVHGWEDPDPDSVVDEGARKRLDELRKKNDELDRWPKTAEEFREFYKDKKITFANTTCFEGFLTMVFTPRRGMGKWVPIDDAAPGSQRFAQFFAKFTPMQTSYYFMNMTRQVFEALLLNGAQSL